MSDVASELLRLVHAYHWRWVVVHGDHGPECELCAGLHDRHRWALKAMEAEPDDNGEPLEAAA